MPRKTKSGAIKVGLVQMSCSNDPAANLTQATARIEAAAKRGDFNEVVHGREGRRFHFREEPRVSCRSLRSAITSFSSRLRDSVRLTSSNTSFSSARRSVSS